jgi:exonuclease SbcC
MEKSDTEPNNSASSGEAHLREQLLKLEQALQEGHLKQAQKFHSQFHKSSQTTKLPRSLREDFSKLSYRLKELEDWQVFATSPKRQALCERMKALITAEDHPDQKIKELKQLHTDWRQLGAANTRQAHRLWNKFKADGDKVYATCAEYFKERDRLRLQNQVAREQICATLEKSTEDANWSSMNYPSVLSLMNKSHDDWRRHGDIPPKQHRILNERFHAALDPIKQKMDEELNRNLEHKQNIIEQLQTCLDSETDASTMTALAKRLQQEWKSVGITHRGKDQKHWRIFRKLCDATFARRDQEAIEKRESAKNDAQKARGICKELASEDIDKARLQALRSEFLALEQPSNTKEFESLMQRAKVRLADRHEDLLIEDIKRKASLCSLVEDKTYDISQAQEAWPGSVDLPVEFEQLLVSRLENTPVNSDETEKLCVKLEMLVGIEAPDSAAMRMQIQVELLQKGLGQGIKEERTKKKQCRDLQMTFYCLPALPATMDRFRTAEDVFTQNTPKVREEQH